MTQGQKDGKAWEEELRDACRTCLGWSYNFNNIGHQTFAKPKSRFDTGNSFSRPKAKAKRPADRLTILDGRLVLIEAKATRGPSLLRSVLDSYQEKSLYAVHKAGGLSVVAIRWWCEKRKRWAINGLCHYADFVATIRESGRKSLPLSKGVPTFFVELEKKRFPEGIRFDIKSGLEQLASQTPAELYQYPPVVELR